MDRAEIEKIANSVAHEVVEKYRDPKTISHGLAESMGEESAASGVYRKRSTNAFNQHDYQTATLYDHVAREEETHYHEFEHRLAQIISSECTLKMDRMGNITINHTAYTEDVFLQFESDKELVYDVVKPDEKEELDKGYPVTIPDFEARASILWDIWYTQHPAVALLATSEGDPLRKFCCRFGDACAPGELLQEGKFPERIAWLRKHYEEKHPGMWGKMIAMATSPSMRGVLSQDIWKMRREEFIKQDLERYREDCKALGFTLNEQLQRRFSSEHHEKAVRGALSIGKPVPTEVLRDYPNLALPKEDKYLTSNPPMTVTEDNKVWHVHMSFRNRKEADQEAQDMRDSGHVMKVFPWEQWYAVYELYPEEKTSPKALAVR